MMQMSEIYFYLDDKFITYVCVCVCEREREREREIFTFNIYMPKFMIYTYFLRRKIVYKITILYLELQTCKMTVVKIIF